MAGGYGKQKKKKMPKRTTAKKTTKRSYKGKKK